MEQSSNFTFRVVQRFKDAITGEYHEKDTLFSTNDLERAKLIEKHYGVLKSGYAGGLWSEEELPMVVYTARVFAYGGIETALLNIAKYFGKRVAFVFTYCDLEVMGQLAKYSKVKIEDGSEIKCKVFLVMGYDGLRIFKSPLVAGKIYHQIHADWASLRKLPRYSGHKISTENIDKFLSVSETVKDGLSVCYGINSDIVPNILMPAELPDFKVFVALTRLEREKGGDILVSLMKRFQDAGKRFICIVCGAGSEQSTIWQAANAMPNMILLPANRDNIGLLRKADYLVQTSRSEAYGYSMHEALANSVPVLATRLPETQRFIKPGKNGYLFNADLSDLDIDTIFDKVPKFQGRWEKVEPIWEKVYEGEL